LDRAKSISEIDKMHLIERGLIRQWHSLFLLNFRHLAPVFFAAFRQCMAWIQGLLPLFLRNLPAKSESGASLWRKAGFLPPEFAQGIT
jgi:hypothetical protein